MRIIVNGVIMDSVETCKPCRGAKQIVGLGNLKKQCPTCIGVGYITKVSEKDEDELLNAPAEVAPIKKKKVTKAKKDIL